MNTKQNVATVAMIAVVLMAAALTPSMANAQPSMQGKFSLSCTTYWGDTKLPAGDYTFNVTRISLHADIIEVRGAGRVRHVAVSTPERQNEASSLTLAKPNGVAVARTLYLAELGRTFRIPAAKSGKEMLASLRPSEIEMTKVAVVMAADE